MLNNIADGRLPIKQMVTGWQSPPSPRNRATVAALKVYCEVKRGKVKR
jgi:hypothetical protein